MKYSKTPKGLKVLFWRVIIFQSLSIIFMIISKITSIATDGLENACKLADSIVFLTGLCLMRNEWEGAKSACKLQAAGVVVTGLTIALQFCAPEEAAEGTLKILSLILSLASASLGLIVLYRLLKGIGGLCTEVGKFDLCELGDKVWRLNWIVIGLPLAMMLLALILGPAILRLLIAVGSVIALVVCSIIYEINYLSFLYHARKALLEAR